jgi:hypothetical protein
VISIAAYLPGNDGATFTGRIVALDGGYMA